ncbi:antitoxin [Moraxella caviae]|uniref:Antitoxin n=1 Tax=Moraxella caviae TaxID=34060 RepID=A0A1S9ZW74_9GAMM|nr:BrnA antitoxin family protein [Moraxella caviae]OOR87718.1 antitoxin [Moraxella caviae]STZ10127.1 Uncharacterized protein conserved in bacteria [Moraxella caviae]VEW11103.1 Uncharacterized protein conserved in bacteria [Moraxella caviae]
MKQEYDFSTMKSRPNPYAAQLKAAEQPITIRLSAEVIEYFKKIGLENGMSYQSMIDLYLQDCVKQQRKLAWV